MPRKLPGIGLQETVFFSLKLFQREFYNTQLQHGDGAVGARAVGFSAQWVGFLSPQSSSSLELQCPNQLGLAGQKEAEVTLQVGSCPRQYQSQRTDTAGGRLSQGVLLCHLVFVPWAVWSSLEAAVLGWGFSIILFSLFLGSPQRIQYLFTLWLLLLSRLSLFSFLVNLFFHLYLLTFISP